MHFGRLIKLAFIFNIILMNLVVNALIDVEIVKDYFKEKMIRYGTIIGCFTDREYFLLTKSLAFGNQNLAFVNVKHMRRTDKLWFLQANKSHIGVVLDGDCGQNILEPFLLQCGRNNYFDVKVHWLIITMNSNFTNMFKNVELYINADINIMFPTKNNDNFYKVQDVYNPASTKGGDLKTINLGEYNKNLGFRIKKEEYKYWLRKNMTGVILKTVLVLPTEFKGTLMDYLHSRNHLEVNTLDRFNYEIVTSCVNYYNFTPDISRHKSWGYLQNDGKFDGMTGQLERRLIDYGSSPLLYRVDRSKVIDFGRETWIFRVAFVFRDQKTVNWVDAFLKPFTMSVWVCLLFIFLLTIVFSKFSNLVEKRNVRQHAETSWSYLLMNTLGAFCQQGIGSVPCSISGRITTFFMFICSLLIYQFYSASIVSSLLTKPNTEIKSIENLLHSKLKVGCEDKIYTKDYFRYTTHKPSKDLYLTKIRGKGNSSNYFSAEDGLLMVRKGGYAFHVELATGYPIISKTFSDRIIDELREVQFITSQPTFFNLQKKSPFKDMFNTCLLRLAEYGILNKERRFWEPKKPQGAHSTLYLISFSLDYFYPLLTMLLIGIIISVIILTLEISMHLRQRTKKETPIFQFIH